MLSIMDRSLINALVLGGVTWYFTRDMMPALVVGATSFVLGRI